MALTAPSRPTPLSTARFSIWPEGGIAPILALLEAEILDSNNPVRAITVIVSVRRDADLIDSDRLLEWQASGRIRFIRTVTRDENASPPRGRIPLQMDALAGDLSRHQVFICGGEGFVIGCERAARTCGAQPGSVHGESFFSDPVPWSGVVSGAA